MARFDVSHGEGEWETEFASKDDAIAWARGKGLDSFAVVDEHDAVVFQEFPDLKWV